MMNSRFLNILLSLLALSLALWPSSGLAQLDASFLEKPVDTIDAENVRLWLRMEQEVKCRVIVIITDQHGLTVRQVMNGMLTRGYYNLYWDKKDDSGNFVDSGLYYYDSKVCGLTQRGKLNVVYKEWERFSRLRTENFKDSGLIYLEFDNDSATATLAMENNRGAVVHTPIADSLFSKGRHRFQWQPDKLIPSGEYTVKLQIGDYVHAEKIRYSKKR